MAGLNPFELVGLLAVTAGAVKIVSPLVSAVAERIRGRPPVAPDAELAAEVDHLRGRLAEVEDRLDFAERLLAQARPADQLPGETHQ